MRGSLIILAAILFAPFVTCAKEVTLLQGAIRLTIPDSFSRLSADEIALKFPRNNRPPFAAFGDEGRNAMIAFTLSKQQRPFSEEHLPEFLSAMEQLFPRLLAGLVWHKRELASLNGRKWGRLYLSAHAKETDVKNDMYFTSFRGDILGVNMTASVAAWDIAATALSKAFHTIRIYENTP